MFLLIRLINQPLFYSSPFLKNYVLYKSYLSASIEPVPRLAFPCQWGSHRTRAWWYWRCKERCTTRTLARVPRIVAWTCDLSSFELHTLSSSPCLPQAQSNPRSILFQEQTSQAPLWCCLLYILPCWMPEGLKRENDVWRLFSYYMTVSRKDWGLPNLRNLIGWNWYWPRF